METINRLAFPTHKENNPNHLHTVGYTDFKLPVLRKHWCLIDSL